MAEFPKHVGGGWYELSNGETVRGKDEAVEVQESLDNDTDAEMEDAPVVDEAVEPEVEEPDTVQNYAENTEGIADDAETIIVRMTSNNVRRQLRGYEWSRANPFAVVNREDADLILSKTGFERATPAQVDRFYE